MAPKYEDFPNVPAEGISYFTPAQHIPPGTAANPQSDGTPPPKLFQPLQIRGMVMQNRIALAPLQQYSCHDGHMTDWHIAHMGGIAQRGPGFLMFEGTAILPEGRISPQDAGLWQDSQIEPMRRVVEFIHSQGQKIGIQIFHAGRKASGVAPWLAAGAVSTVNVGGWPDQNKGPSAIAYNDRAPIPDAMTEADIEEVKAAWVAAIKRALKAGVDFIEIHVAHGFLLHSFASPVSNKRTDKYGGSFENRIRLSLEIAELTRQNIPDTMPVMLRISATDWLEKSLPQAESWKLENTVRMAKALADQGCIDVLDISSGGSHPAQQICTGPCFQVPFAKSVKAAVGDKLLVGAVGMIHTGEIANALVTEAGLDFVLVGRGFQKNPGLVWTWAEELNVDISMSNQNQWGFSRRGADNLYIVHKDIAK